MCVCVWCVRDWTCTQHGQAGKNTAADYQRRCKAGKVVKWQIWSLLVQLLIDTTWLVDMCRHHSLFTVCADIAGLCQSNSDCAIWCHYCTMSFNCSHVKMPEIRENMSWLLLLSCSACYVLSLAGSRPIRRRKATISEGSALISSLRDRNVFHRSWFHATRPGGCWLTTTA